nr:sporulation-specific protein 15-like [Ipomoea trifida]
MHSHSRPIYLIKKTPHQRTHTSILFTWPRAIRSSETQGPSLASVCPKTKLRSSSTFPLFSVKFSQLYNHKARVFDVSYNAESKTSSLKAKIVVLEKKNRQLIHENEVIIKEKTEKLKQTINTSSNEKTELQKRVDELESKTARVAEHEGELSQLRDNLSKSLNDLVDSNSKASLLRSTMIGLKSSENEKEIKIQAIEEEKNLLILKVEKLEASRDNQKADKKLTEQQITYFKNSVVNLEASVVIN